MLTQINTGNVYTIDSETGGTVTFLQVSQPINVADRAATRIVELEAEIESLEMTARRTCDQDRRALIEGTIETIETEIGRISALVAPRAIAA